MGIFRDDSHDFLRTFLFSLRYICSCKGKSYPDPCLFSAFHRQDDDPPLQIIGCSAGQLLCGAIRRSMYLRIVKMTNIRLFPTSTGSYHWGCLRDLGIFKRVPVTTESTITDGTQSGNDDFPITGESTGYEQVCLLGKSQRWFGIAHHACR